MEIEIVEVDPSDKIFGDVRMGHQFLWKDRLCQRVTYSKEYNIWNFTNSTVWSCNASDPVELVTITKIEYKRD